LLATGLPAAGHEFWVHFWWKNIDRQHVDEDFVVEILNVIGVRCDSFRYLPCGLSYANGSFLSVENTAPSSRSSLSSTSLMISRARGSTVLTSFTNSQSRLAEGWVPFSFSNAAALSQFDRSRPLAFQAGATSSALAKKNPPRGQAR